MGFLSSLGDSINLIKQTFLVVKKNPAIVSPTFRELLIVIVLYVLAAIGLIGYVLTFIFVQSDSTVVFSILGTDYSYSAAGFTSIASTLFYVFGIILLFLFPFVKTYYRAAQSWMVYETFTKGTGTFKDGISRARKNMGDIFALTIIDILVNALSRQLKSGGKGKGIIGIILGIILFFIARFIEEVWDLVGHYLLPATIIEDKNIIEAIPSLKNMRNNVPGALVGVFGIDFAGDLAKGLLFILLFVLGIGAIALGIFFGLWWLTVLLIILYIGIFIIFGVFLDMLKTVYFTLFYMAVNHPGEILPEYRDEVTRYLLNPSVSTAKGANSTAATYPSQSTPKLSPSETAEQVEKLTPFVQQYRQQNMTDAQITDLLKRYGWPDSTIKKTLEK
jgi:hypothetical protein